jgi:hypothetical protein
MTRSVAKWAGPFVGAVLLVSMWACSGKGVNEPGPSQPPSSTTAQPATTPLASSVRAPGSENLPPDEHPELAHLTQVSTDSLADAITSYVVAESKQRGGSFPIPAPNGGAPHEVTLSAVHRERISKLADGRYFACADFKEPNGTTYDVDIFMRAESKGLVPSDIIVHKVNGTARFNWVERDGAWVAMPITK